MGALGGGLAYTLLKFSLVSPLVSLGFAWCRLCFAWFRPRFRLVSPLASLGVAPGFAWFRPWVRLVSPLVSLGFAPGFAWFRLSFAYTILTFNLVPHLV